MKSYDTAKPLEQTLLTIAVPTYNRSALLDLCLNTIKEELYLLDETKRHLVKIYVSDNASTDDTQEVIAKYDNLPAGEVEFVRNKENIGGKGNVLQCYNSATSSYVWVLGDDDVILSGGLKSVLTVLSKKDVDIVYVRGYGYKDSYLKVPIQGKWGKGFVEYSNALDFVKRTHMMLAFITAIIARGNVKDEFTSKVVEGSNFPQFRWILPLIRDGKKFVIINDKVFAAKILNALNAAGYRHVKVFAHDLSAISNTVFDQQPKIAQAIQNGIIMKWSPNHIMYCRTGEVNYLEEDLANEFEQAFRHNWRYYFFIVPLFSLPLFFARFYFYFIVAIRKLFGHHLK